MRRATQPIPKPAAHAGTGQGASAWRTGSSLSMILGAIVFAGAIIPGPSSRPGLLLAASLILVAAGAVGRAAAVYLSRPAGIRNEYVMSRGLTTQGPGAWPIAAIFMLFYVTHYWFPRTHENLNALMDPLSQLLRTREASIYFSYAALYTFAILVMGVRAWIRYRHSRYHLTRTGVNMGAQLIAAFLIPAFLTAIDEPQKYVNYFWPLSQEDIFPSTVAYMLKPQFKLGVFLLFWSIALSFVGVPLLAFAFGKRWYCSWVCGCGALANTLGDRWRHLSDKRLSAWRFERISIYSVLVLIVTITALLWLGALTGSGFLEAVSAKAATWYGAAIMSVWAGVLGTGLYSLMGTRVWCRFGCPQAAILGILQKRFSRFRITTNGSQCMSCGHCSAYCEMGIDVRWYAQRGQNIVRASCVGCGMCASVCPRGVLRLENGPRNNRFSGSIDPAGSRKGVQNRRE